MAFYENVQARSYIANAALSQFVFVTLGSNGKVALTGVGARGDAVTFTSTTAANQAVTGVYDGRAMIKAGGTIAKGGAVASSAAGLAVAAATGNIILGYSLEDAVINQILTVELNRAGTLAP